MEYGKRPGEGQKGEKSIVEKKCLRLWRHYLRLGATPVAGSRADDWPWEEERGGGIADIKGPRGRTL